MDMLDPLEHSGEESIGGKVLVDSKGLSIITTEVTMDSDDEQKVVSHLSPETLLETSPESEVQYSFTAPEGTITCRVLQVDESADHVPQIVAANSNFGNAGGVSQMLTGNLNGHWYVIGNANEVCSAQSGSRTLAPRASCIETSPPAVVASLKKRDERRRATHNEVERRRRDKINNWITKLSKIIPETNLPDMNKGNGGHHESQSKGGILAKACEYIVELKEDQRKLEVCLKENKQIAQELDVLRNQNLALEDENRVLRELMQRSGLEVPKMELVSS